MGHEQLRSLPPTFPDLVAIDAGSLGVWCSGIHPRALTLALRSARSRPCRTSAPLMITAAESIIERPGGLPLRRIGAQRCIRGKVPYKRPVQIVNPFGGIDRARHSFFPRVTDITIDIVLDPHVVAPSTEPTLQMPYDTLREFDAVWKASASGSRGNVVIRGARCEVGALKSPPVEGIFSSVKALRGARLYQEGDD